MAAAFKELATGLKFPEGPVALPDGSILLTEIATRKLTRVFSDGRKELAVAMGGGPNGAAMGPEGKIYVTNNGGFLWHEDAQGVRPVMQPPDYSGGRIERVDLATGKIETLYTECNGHKLRGPNDLVFDGNGGFYFTDLGKARARDMDRGGIYYAKADGSMIREVAYPAMTPNGIGLSPDGNTLYYAETEGARLWAFDLIGPGEAKKLPWPSPNGARLVAQCGGDYQRFDSLAVDADGNICVATLFKGGITVISPDGGSIRHVDIPGDPYCTNICFGGPDLKTAYITLSLTGRLISMPWDRPGLRLHHQ